MLDNWCTTGAVVCLTWAGSATSICQADNAVTADTTLLESADGALLEQTLADVEDDGAELTLRMRWRQRSTSRDQASVYRRVQWATPSGHQFHILAERDAGEPDWHDFVALYGRLRLPGATEVHVGDLRPGFAQGIVFSRGGRRGGTVSPRRRGDSDLVGYRAAGENQALRGASVRARYRDFDATLIAGGVRRDARLDSAGRVTSLPDGGRHVSATERAGKDRLSATVIGLRLRRLHELLQLGATVKRFAADNHRIDLRRPLTRPRAFEGDTQRLAAVDASLGQRRRRAAAVFAEVAVDDRSEWAWVAGGRLTFRQTGFDALARYYSSGFHSFFGGSASATGMQNELGLALALRGPPGRLVRWRLFADRYRRPRPAHGANTPMSSSTSGGSVRSRLSERWHLVTHVQQRRRLRSGRAPHDFSLGLRVDAIREAARVSSTVQLRTEWKRVRVQSEAAQHGVNISLRWRRKQNAHDYVLHLSRFMTESYDSRIYEYERDLPGAVSIRPLYGNGWRAYAMLQRRWGKALSVSIRWRHERDAQRRRRGTLIGVQIDYTGPR